MSLYLYARKNGAFKGTFESFCKSIEKLRKKHKGANNVIETGLRQQLSYFKPRQVNFVGRYENLEEDFKKLCKKLKINQLELRYVKRTRTLPDGKVRSYRDSYTPELKSMVDKAFKDDIIYLGYKY